jgi:putative lipoic acid-binding regulatory protein
VRAQAFSGPRSWAHFRAIALCAAGRDEGSFRFEATQLVEQIGFFLRLIERLETLDLRFSKPTVSITDVAGTLTDTLRARVLEPLSRQFPDAEVVFDPERKSGRGYYATVCFKVHATNAEGQRLELADGGDVTWTRALLSDAKERLVISGLGVERLAVR